MRTLLFLPIFILGLVAVAPFLTGCDGSDPAVESRLREAALVVVASPDSAIALLETVPRSDLRGEQRARHALEMAEAVWIKDGHLYDDSLITVAADYYEGRGDSLDIKSQFLKGVSLYDRREYGRALVSLMETYDRALSEGHRYYAAMCARTLGWVYHMLMIVDKNYEWTKRSYDMFVELGMPVNAAWRQMDLADALVYKRQYEAAESVLNSIDSTIIRADRALDIEIAKSNLIIMTDCDRYDDALQQIAYFKSLGHIPSIVWGELSLISVLKGDIDLALTARDSLLSTTTSYQDTLYSEYLYALILEVQGEYKQAYKQALNWGDNVGKYTEKAIIDPEYILLNDYLETKARNRDLELNRSYWMIFCAIVVMLLLIVLCIHLNLLTNKYRLISKAEKEKAESFGNDILELKYKLESMENSRESLQRDVVLMLKNKYALLDQLCNICFNSKEKNNLEQFKYKVSQILEHFQKEVTLSEIESLIDANDVGWMANFRKLLPNLKAHQYRLAIYLYLGFSTSSIAILTGKEKKDNVYVDKSILKSKIVELDSQIAEKLLKDLNMVSSIKSKDV